MNEMQALPVDLFAGRVADEVDEADHDCDDQRHAENRAVLRLQEACERKFESLANSCSANLQRLRGWRR